MAKQLNVDLKFNADTSQAKAAIQTLISDLNKLTNVSAIGSDLPITKEIMEAQMAAKQLGQSLEKAFNTDTGKLDLTKFTQQLNSSGMSLTDYGNKLSMLGAEGDKAFLKIAQSIAATQAPLKQSSGLLANFATTLKNTARWQISSSILHGFMGTVQSAYGYAQDLNRSLNDIRIVTGQNVDQMDAFAERANRAAKELSTTTTAYTNASLIFYQQGLDDSEVQERTNVVIKMANASQQSAKLTADQLTAVWNNFDDGSKSLEYYADVMTALGAATASSTSEIADGLEKFAAIADTVGLSYEYATSALATVTATTRQSADVVGTAFKTLFARIQDLELGETLDDGTTLGKYSEALAAVGINIKDTSGEIKDMNQILDEMGDKWNDLSKDTQIALAQTVAGTRQYTQLVALMDNWDYFQENLGVANTATGTLQDQADIYAESWEASKDRVRASAEEIYSSLLDDDFFIKLNDTFAKMLSGISLFIDALGGIKGVLPGIGLLLTSIFKEDMANGINNALQNFKLFTGVAQQELSQLKGEAYEAAMSMTKGFDNQLNIQALREALTSTFDLQNQLTASVKQMSPEQRKVAEAALESAQNYNAMAVELAEAADAAERLFQKQKMANTESRKATMATMQQHYDNSVGQGGSDLLASARGMSTNAGQLGVNTNDLDNAIQKYSQAMHELDKAPQSAEAMQKFTDAAIKLRAAMDQISTGASNANSGITAYITNLSNGAEQAASAQGKFYEMKKALETKGVTNETVKGLSEVSKVFGTSSESAKQLRNTLKQYRAEIRNAKGDTDKIAEAQKNFQNSLSRIEITTNDVTQRTAELANATKQGGQNIPVLTNEMRGMAATAAEVAINNRNAGEAISTAGKKSQEAAANIRIATLAYQSIGSAITGALGAMSSFAMGLNALNSIYDTLNNNDLSTFEKTTSIMMSLSMAVPALTGSFSKLGNVLKFVISTQKQGLTAQLASLMGIKAEDMGTKYFIISKTAEGHVRKQATDATKAEAAQKAGATVVTEIDTAKTWANIAAKMAQHWYILLIVAALAALAAAIYVAVSAYNEEAAAAEQARGAIEECNEAQQDLQKSVEELDGAWKTYDTAIEKLKKCTKGTDEWKEALSEVNGAALDVIDSLDGLDLSAEEIKALYNTDKGYMEIDTDKLKDYKDQMVDMAEAAEYAADFSKVYASKKTNSADLLTEMRKASSTQEYMAQEGYGTTDSEGNYYGMVDEQKITDTILKNTEDWLNLSESEFSDKLKELGINVDLLSSTALSNLQSKVEELASSTAAANEKLLLIAKIKVEEELGDDYGEAEKAIASSQLANRTDELTDAWYDYLTSNSDDTIDFGGDIGTKTSSGINKASGGDNSIYLEAVQALKDAGYNWSAFTGNAVLGDDNNRRFIFTDENGEQTKEKSAAWVAETIAAAQALAELTGNAEQAGAALSGMENRVSESGASAIKKMISEGNINSLTQGELSELKTGMDSDNGGNVSSDEAIAYLRNAFADTGLAGEKLDAYIAAMFGKESITEVGESWSEIIAGTEEAWGNLADGFTRTVGNILNSIDTSSLSMDQVQDLGNLLTQAFTVGGSEGAKVLEDMYTKAAEQGLGDEFINALSGIDWTTITPEGLSEHLNDAGIAINFSDAELQNLINTMYEAADSFDSASNKYKTLNEIIKTLKQGDTISADQFEALGPGMEDYFMRMADGTYKLIGDAEAFYAAVNDEQIEGFENTIESKTKDNAAIENVLSYDIGALGSMDSTTMGGHYYTGGGNFVQNTNVANAQLDFLAQTGYNPEQVAQWRQDMQDGVLDVKALTTAVNEKTTSLGGATAAEERLTQQLNINNTEIEHSKEAIASTATSIEQLSDYLNAGTIDQAQYGDGLVLIASQYEDCEDAIKKYNDEIANCEEGSKEARQAQNKLAKEIKKAQWKKFAKDAKEAAKALEDVTNPDDLKKNLKTIQKAFKDSFGMDVSMELLDKYKDKFVEWANAGEEASDDIATEIYSLLSLEEAAEDPISITTDITDAGFEVNNLASIFDQVKAYIENNGITVSATGQADLSGMVAELLASGKTAAEVAAALKAIGQTQVSFDALGSGLATYDIGTLDGLIAFINDLTDFHGNIDTDGAVPNADEINEAFGESGFTGTGGGMIPAGDNSGGGGGGAKKADRKNTGDKERYHTINNQLEDLKSEYDDISDAADRAFGANKLKLMDAQIAKTDEMIDKQEEYLKSIKDNLDTDKALMETYLSDAFGGEAPTIKYDEKGNIENFDEIQDYMYADHDAKADAYEAGKMSQEDWEIYEKKYELFEKQLAQYEESYDLLRDEEQAYQDLLNQKIDEKLAKTQYQVELKLNVSQDELAIIEHQMDMLDDKAFASATRIEKSVEKANNLTKQIETNTQALDDVLKASGLSEGEISSIEKGDYTGLENKNFTEDQIDAIREYRDNLLDLNSQLLEVRDTIREEVTAAFEEYNEALDKGISKFDHYNSVLESYQNIVDIVGKDALGVSDEMMAEMSATKVENSINQLNAVREKYESITKARDDALAKSEDMSLTEEDRKYWAEQYETMNESAQEAQEELMSTWESTLEGIVAQFEESVQRAVDAFNKAIYDGGLEGLSEDFEWEQEKDDMYLDDYQKIYELSKMTRDINKTMDDTKSIAGKQKLKGLIEDINKLQEEGVEMSEYDLEYLQAEYDLRLAEIALEDAQRAKDTVRLSRDSEGNFSYVYTQNTDAVDEAQQKYEDALYSMQDLSSNYIDEMSAQLIETSQAMQEELAALRVEDYASIDEYYAAVAEVEAKYQDKLSRQEAELQKAIGNNKKLYDEDWANYAVATGYKISATEDFVTAWGDTTLAGMMGLDDTTGFTSVIGSAAESLVSGLLDAANTYYNNVDAANEAAGTSTGQFAEVLQENIDAINTESAEAAKAVEEMASKMDTAMQSIIDKTAEWQSKHSENIEKIIADNIKAAQSYNGLLEYLSNNAIGDYEVLVRPSSNGNGDGDSSEGEGFATGGYTGSWGASGKLAWLHEKELILNKNDTENMLKMIELTRAMISTIDAQASQLSQGMGMMSAATYKEDRHEILEQFVEIKADFPNVSNHTEIEEALGNLINTASQYAHRRK